MPYSFDATLKDIVTPHPEEFVSVFGLPRLQPASALNVDLSTISAATDVAIGFGNPIQQIADLNFQSGPDPDLAARCLLYNAALHLRFKAPVRTLLVLLRPRADSKAITGKLAYGSGGSGVEFSYEVVWMWQQPVDAFLEGGVQLLPLAMLCRLPAKTRAEKALREVVLRIEQRLARECSHAQAARLMTAAFVLTGLRIKRRAAASIFEEVRLMHESSTYQLILEEGGIREAQRFLLRLGKGRFGAPDESTAAAVRSIKDLDRLERMGDAILIVSTWQDLLATP